MSRAGFWLTDKVRNKARRISRAQDDAGAPWGLGPRTIDTPAEVATLLEGLEVPVASGIIELKGTVSPEFAAELKRQYQKRFPKPHDSPYVAAIQMAAHRMGRPVTADELVDYVVRHHSDWSRASVKRRVSDARLRVVDRDGVSKKLRRCTRYVA